MQFSFVFKGIWDVLIINVRHFEVGSFRVEVKCKETVQKPFHWGCILIAVAGGVVGVGAFHTGIHTVSCTKCVTAL